MAQGSGMTALMIGVLAACGAMIAPPSTTLAQNITLDGTLGPAGTLTGPTYTIPQGVGTTVGTNLFHSFGRFNLNTGEIANFQSAADIRNILARVTGGFPSSIDGLIRTESANVNLFLINPSGILFGPNARLEIGSATRGSFVATTLDAITFPNGRQFSAVNPSGSSSLLTIVGDPSGFLASQRNPQPITVNSSVLAVYPGQSLALLGGNVSVKDALLSWYIPPAGTLVDGIHITIGGVDGAGIIGLSTNGNQLSLQIPVSQIHADVSITDGSVLYSSADTGGSITVYGKNLNILGGSQLLAGIQANSGLPGSQAGDITLNASETLTIAGRSTSIYNDVNDNATGNSGNINISAGSFIMKDGAVTADTLGKGNSGRVNITVKDAMVLDGKNAASIIESDVEAGGNGNSGGIYISTGSLLLKDTARISSQIYSGGKGNSGGITVYASDSVTLDGAEQVSNTLFFPSALFSRVLTGGEGNSGDITITSRSLNITNRAQIASTTQGLGNAGSVFVDVQGQVFLLNSTIISEVTENLGQGNGGDITIKAGSLVLKDGAALLADTEYKGNAGRITIEAGSVLLEGRGPSQGDFRITIPSQISTTVELNATGNGGDIDITTGSLVIKDEGFINSTTYGTGRPGDITLHVNTLSAIDGSTITADTFGAANAGRLAITAENLVEVVGQGSFLSVDTAFGATGQGGDLVITAKRVSVRDGGSISTNTFGTGNAGRLSITATDLVEVVDVSLDEQLPSELAASAFGRARGNGGDLVIQTERLSIRNGAQITVSNQGTGRAGNLEVNARSVVLNNRGKINAESATGNGGNITLNVQDTLLLRRGSLISTTAGTAQAGGDGGNITITAPRGFIVGVKSENSDITANAFTGSGGRINITAQGIYGLRFQPQLTRFSDITASSEFGISGVVTLNTPDVDPNRGLVQLPVNVVDPSQQIDQSCVPGSRQFGGRFVVTGRGGVPESPTEPLQDQTVITEWVTVEGNREQGIEDRVMQRRGDTENEEITASSRPHPTPVRLSAHVEAPHPSNQIVEATGWIREPDGTIALVAEMPTVEPRNFWHTLPPCPQ